MNTVLEADERCPTCGRTGATPAGVTAATLTGDLAFSAGGMGVDSLTGGFVKSVAADGTVAYQMPNGTQATMQIGQAKGAATFFATATFSAADSTITMIKDSTLTGNPEQLDMIYFDVPDELVDDVSGSPLRIAIGSVSFPLRDHNNNPVIANQLQPGQLTGVFWSSIGTFVTLQPPPAALPIPYTRYSWVSPVGDSTMPTAAQVLASGDSSPSGSTSIATTNPGHTGYGWFFDRSDGVNYIGLVATGGNQIGAFQAPAAITIDGHQYYGYSTRQELAGAAFDLIWYVYTTT